MAHRAGGSCVKACLVFAGLLSQCHSLMTSRFALAKGAEPSSSEGCYEALRPGAQSRLRCASTCSFTPTCRGFIFSCPPSLPPPPLSACQCRLCPAAPRPGNVTSQGAASGVMTSKVIYQPNQSSVLSTTADITVPVTNSYVTSSTTVNGETGTSPASSSYSLAPVTESVKKSDGTSSDTTNDVTTQATMKDVTNPATVIDVTSRTTVNDVTSRTTVNDFTSRTTVNDVTSPPTVNEINSPATANDVTSRPTVNDDTSQPTVNDVTSRATVNDVTSPSTANDVTSRTTVNDVTSPSTINEITSPATANDVTSRPTVNDVTSQPTVNDVTSRATVNDVTSPSTANDVTSRITVNDVTSPSTINEITSPATANDVTSRPTVNDATSQPTVNDVTSRATVNDVTAPATAIDVTSPATANDVTVQTNGVTEMTPAFSFSSVAPQGTTMGSAEFPTSPEQTPTPTTTATATTSTATITTTTTTTTDTPALQLQCAPPPLIERTTVKHTATATHDVAHYRCSVSTDVYVRGTTDVTCTTNSGWLKPTILCAATDCWYVHWYWSRVYRGSVAQTIDETSCLPWTQHTRVIGWFTVDIIKSEVYTLDESFISDNGSMADAANHCRAFNSTFDAEDTYAWCYKSANYLPINFQACDVPLCSNLSGIRQP